MVLVQEAVCVIVYFKSVGKMSSNPVLKEVIEMLQMINVEQLLEVCNELEITVPEVKKGNGSLLLNLVMRHLHSDTVEALEDQGMSVFLKLNDDLKVMVDKKPTDIGNGTSPMDGRVKAEPKQPHIEVHKLREFKINGTVGMGQKDSLSYTSLSFQIQQGKAAGYSIKEIMAAVVKAIKPGTSLRDFLEIWVDITEEDFIEVLRSHYTDKNSSAALNELSNNVQNPDESELDFCMRMISLRQRVLTLSAEEGCPISEAVVKKRFFQTLGQGFIKDYIRLELSSTLKENNLRDVDLLKEISSAVAKESERLNKIKANKIMVSKVDVEEKSSKRSSNSSSCGKNKEDALLTEIRQLHAKFDELSAVKNEISDLKKELAGYKSQKVLSVPSPVSQPVAPAQHRQPRRIFSKCQNCAPTNAFCTHCFLCGSGEHKRNACPLNVQKN